MGAERAPSASLVQPACAIRAPSTSSTARPRPSHACCATRTRYLMDDDPPLGPGQPGPAPAAAPEPAEDTAAALADLKRDRDDLYDRLLRKTAEFDNYRRRLEREGAEKADQAGMH